MTWPSLFPADSAALGAELVRLRRGAGLRLTAARVGISPGYLWKLEQGLCRPRRQTLVKLAAVYGRDVADLERVAGRACAPDRQGAMDHQPVAKPPPTLCAGRRKDGEQCGAFAVKGTDLCVAHGGSVVKLRWQLESLASSDARTLARDLEAVLGYVAPRTTDGSAEASR